MTRNKKIIRRWKQMVLRRLFYERNDRARLELINALQTLERYDQGLITGAEADVLAEVEAFQEILFDWWSRFVEVKLAADRRRPSLD